MQIITHYGWCRAAHRAVTCIMTNFMWKQHLWNWPGVYQISYTSLHDNLSRNQITGNYSVVKRLMEIKNNLGLEHLFGSGVEPWTTASLVWISQRTFGECHFPSLYRRSTTHETNIESEHSFYGNMQDLTMTYVLNLTMSSHTWSFTAPKCNESSMLNSCN